MGAGSPLAWGAGGVVPARAAGAVTANAAAATRAARTDAVPTNAFIVSSLCDLMFPVPTEQRPLRPRLRDALVAAMKAADKAAVSALRSALAAIDNAEATGAAVAPGGLAIEQSPVGVGVADVPRRVLTDAEVRRIVENEVAEREAAARDYDRANRPQRADLLRAEAGVLCAHLNGTA